MIGADELTLEDRHHNVVSVFRGPDAVEHRREMIVFLELNGLMVRGNTVHAAKAEIEAVMAAITLHPDKPAHGASRGFERTFRQGDPFEAVMPGGNVVQMPSGGVESFTEERYCTKCDEWTRVNGIVDTVLGCSSCGGPF